MGHYVLVLKKNFQCHKKVEKMVQVACGCKSEFERCVSKLQAL